MGLCQSNHNKLHPLYMLGTMQPKKCICLYYTACLLLYNKVQSLNHNMSYTGPKH